MKLYASLLALALLQANLPTGLAKGGERNLRGSDAEKHEEVERELRPFGYPSERSRPGQFGRLSSLVEFRPYTNSNQYVSDVQQGNIPLVSPTEAPRPLASEPGDLLFRRPASFVGGQPLAAIDHDDDHDEDDHHEDDHHEDEDDHDDAGTPMYRQRTVPTRKFGKAGRVGKSGKSRRSFDPASPAAEPAEPVEGLVPRSNYVPVEDGSYIVGVPRTDSLAESLGFYKVDNSDQVVFYDRDAPATP